MATAIKDHVTLTNRMLQHLEENGGQNGNGNGHGATVGWYSTRRGVESCCQKLYNLKTFVKTNYLKFKTWIVEANMVSL